MKMSRIAFVTALVLVCPTAVLAQATNGSTLAGTTTNGSATMQTAQPASSAASDGGATTVDCQDLSSAPLLDAQQLATLTSSSEITVVQCADAVPAPTPEVSNLRTAISKNPELSTKLQASGAAPEQVIAARRTDGGKFSFYVIGAFR